MDLKKLSLGLALIFLVSNVSAVTFDWRQPLDVENTKFPRDICQADAGTTGEDFWFEVDLSGVDQDYSIDLEKKSANSQTWSTIDSISVDDEYGENQRYFFQDAGNDFVVNESSSNTITIDGNEHTFSIGTINQNNDPNTFQDLKVDGLDDSANANGEILESNPEGRYIKAVDVGDAFFGASYRQVEFEIYEKVRIHEGNTDYRFRLDSEHASEPAYISCNSEKTPVPADVSIDSKDIFPAAPYEWTSGVTPVSNIVVNITERDNDPYNVTLYDGSGNFIAKIQKKGGGSSLSYFDAATDAIVRLFDPVQENQLVFVNDENDNFLDLSSNNYTFYFKIEDDLSTTRYSPEYQASTSGSNAAPIIDSIEFFNGTSWTSSFNYNDTLAKVRVNVSDSNNVRHNAYLNLSDDYDEVQRYDEAYYDQSGQERSYSWNLQGRLNDSGNYTVDIRVTDGGLSDNQSKDFTVPWGSVIPEKFKIDNKSGSVDLNTSQEYRADANFKCIEGECASEKSPVLNGSERLNATFRSNVSTVGACSSTPFCTDDPNPVQWNESVQPGDSFSTYWFFNVTGSAGSTYDLFSGYSSSNANVGSNESDRVQVSILSDNVAPSADFSFSPSSPTTGESISFDGSSSSDSDGTIQQYRWDWENDGTYDDLGETVSHSYGSSGDYDVKLEVVDNEGLTDTRVRTVSVTSSSSGGGGGGSSPSPSENTTSPDDGSGGGGDTSTGGGGEVVTIIKEVNSSEYSWTVAAAGSQGSQYFEPIGFPGREITREIQVSNTGDRSVYLSLECVSSGSVCSWFEISTKSVTLSSGETRSVFVTGTIPGSVSPDQIYEFDVQVTDPTYTGGEGGTASVGFSIAIDPGLGRLLVLVNKVTDSREIGGSNIPYGALGLLAMIGFWIIATLVETLIGERNYPIVKLVSSLLVFVVAVALL